MLGDSLQSNISGLKYTSAWGELANRQFFVIGKFTVCWYIDYKNIGMVLTAIVPEFLSSVDRIAVNE